MREKYLGDSFDIVKRFWVELLNPIADVYLDPRFVPLDLHAALSCFTGARIWNEAEDVHRKFSLLLDPHTGIPLPDARDQRVRKSHAPIQDIARLFDNRKLSFLMCYDQSVKRQAGFPRVAQLDAKRDALLSLGIHSFYYVSHAPFLFASRSATTLRKIRKRMVKTGIPAETSSTIRLQAVN